jgi:hypothetical protein
VGRDLPLASASGLFAAIAFSRLQLRLPFQCTVSGLESVSQVMKVKFDRAPFLIGHVGLVSVRIANML